MIGLPSGVRRVVDVVLEAPVVPSFTRVGADVRAAIDGWSSPAPGSIAGRVVVITGGTSGIGRAAARELAVAGAEVVVTGRDARRAGAVADELTRSTGGHVTAEGADMGDLDAVRSLAARLVAAHDRIDVLIHNAGALTPDRRTSPQGFEQTVASQVYGPFLLTSLLVPQLAGSQVARHASLLSALASSQSSYELRSPSPQVSGTQPIRHSSGSSAASAQNASGTR